MGSFISETAIPNFSATYCFAASFLMPRFSCRRAYQISGSTYSAHSRNEWMRSMHSMWVALRLPTTRQGDRFQHAPWSPLTGASTGTVKGKRNAAYSHAEIGVNRNFRHLGACLAEGDRTGNVPWQCAGGNDIDGRPENGGPRPL